MQTRKAHARYLPGPGGLMWEVTHPHTRVSVWSTYPRDAAALLLQRYVLPRLTDTHAAELHKHTHAPIELRAGDITHA